MDSLIKSIQFTVVLFHSCLADWGGSIIATTLTLRLIFLPLTVFALVQQRRLRDLAPALASLKTLYKDDPRRAAVSSAQLQREAGCKPLVSLAATLVQGFTFIALYKALVRLPELNLASFVWIPNLASPDPLFILPILIAAITLFQFKVGSQRAAGSAHPYTPWLLSIVSCVFTAKLASGVALYYLVSGTFQATTQIVLNRM